MEMPLREQGWDRIRTEVDEALREEVRRVLARVSGPGQRCLLDEPAVRTAAGVLKRQLVAESVLPEEAVAVQAIGFDKTPGSNWKVTWHQDLMFPLGRPAKASGYALPSVKDGVPYARPPLEVLEAMLAVRLHLDACDQDNGPLRVAPGSHRLGIVPAAQLAEVVARHGEQECLAEEGDAILMRPLTLHASSVARQPRHRRVLHIVFHTGSAVAEPWHRAVCPQA